MMPARPWLRLYGEVPADPPVPEDTLYEALASAAGANPRRTALVYLGRRITYRELLDAVDRCAAALVARGLAPGDSVMLSLPNVPNAVILFYAVNRIGARAVMTHPLSSPAELRHYLQQTHSTWAVAMDLFFGRVAEAIADTDVTTLLVCRFSDYLSHAKKVGFVVTRGRKIPPVPTGDPRILAWRTLLKGVSRPRTYERASDPTGSDLVLFSGGTSALPKGIDLSSRNVNALAAAMIAITGMVPGNSVLAILPVFHGFGLGLCIHTPLTIGATSILVPEFSAKIYIDNLIAYRPSYIAGVPTLFQALLADPRFRKVSFSRLRGAYSGGDSLSSALKARVDAALAAQGSRVELMEGYGLTECVTACTVSPPGRYREDSVGIPIPGMSVKVADAEGHELAYGQEGELCVTGPTLMRGYLNDPEATSATLRQEGETTWLRTGDVGTMDADGYVFFKGRTKRIIKVSGVSVYPAQVEQVLEAHPGVRRACVIGVPDEYQMASVLAFVVPFDVGVDRDALRTDLLAHCTAHLMRWAVPRSIEFRDDLPTTLVGKIAYTELEREVARTS